MSSLPGTTLVALLLSAGWASAEGLVLKRDAELSAPTVGGKDAPLFVMADRIESTAPSVVEASGRVEARQAGQNFYADWLRYDFAENTLEARGNVRLEQPTLAVSGEALTLDLDLYSGEFTQPVYQFTDRPGRGGAERIDFIDDKHYRLAGATYTTCPVDNEDWYLRVGDLDLDRTRDVGVARHASLHFLGVPILYTPWMDFSLSGARKTGVLAPTIGTTERSGLDLVVPYYLNLAPNYDATLYPRVLSKRGVQLGGEFRYLLPQVNGVNRLEYLADDREAERSRWSAALTNAFQLSPSIQAGMTYNAVSDDDYFRDLSNMISATSLTHLNREAWVTLQRPTWNAELRAQTFQTLQDSTADPIIEPYSRLPHARVATLQRFDSGLQFELASEATRFAHPTLVEGTRVLAYPRLRMPMTNSYGFVTPQIGWHSTYYDLDETGTQSTITRNLPIFSVDSGVTFERPMRFAGRDYEQTLEPRAYYVYAPYRDQDAIPVFDTALLDFSYAQMFTENQFIGGDRVNDANQLTLAVTSRFTEAATGLERLALTLGQRFYFADQLVTLPGMAPRTSNATDLLAALTGQITRAWRVDAAWQLDTETGTSIRQSFGTSYRPTPGRVLNFGYRHIDQTTEQIDVSGQWPLATRWYGMFRYNHSIQDEKLIEGLAGLEYNAGCWAVRGLYQQLATKEDQDTTSFFLQLEFTGMGRLGTNPLDVLKQSVPGYRPSNEISEAP